MTSLLLNPTFTFLFFHIFLSTSQYCWPLLPWHTSLLCPSLHCTSFCLMGHSNSLCFACFSMMSLILNQWCSSFLYLPSHNLWLLILFMYFWFPNYLPVLETCLVVYRTQLCIYKFDTSTWILYWGCTSQNFPKENSWFHPLSIPAPL